MLDGAEVFAGKFGYPKSEETTAASERARWSLLICQEEALARFLGVGKMRAGRARRKSGGALARILGTQLVTDNLGTTVRLCRHRNGKLSLECHQVHYCRVSKGKKGNHQEAHQRAPHWHYL
eukprot:4939195-Pyramimonas_sp.AAC.1